MDYDKLFAIGFLFAFGAIVIGGAIWCSVLYIFNPCHRRGHSYKLIGTIERQEEFKPNPNFVRELDGYNMKKNYSVFRCELCKDIKLVAISSSKIDL